MSLALHLGLKWYALSTYCLSNFTPSSVSTLSFRSIFSTHCVHQPTSTYARTNSFIKVQSGSSLTKPHITTLSLYSSSECLVRPLTKGHVFLCRDKLRLLTEGMFVPFGPSCAHYGTSTGPSSSYTAKSTQLAFN